MSDYDFTNTSEYTLEQYIDKLGKYYPHTNDIVYAYQVFTDNQLNPMHFFVRAWVEGRKRDNFLLGCGTHDPRYKQGGFMSSFYGQVTRCVQTYVYWYTNACRDNYKVWLYDNKKLHKVSNRATYSLYRYTPRYWEHVYGGWHGSMLYPIVWKRIKNIMESTNE